MASVTNLLDRLLDPVGRALTPESARTLLALRADEAAQRRIDDLAERCNQGQLTADEHAEYQALIAASSMIAVLQSKARAILASNPAA